MIRCDSCDNGIDPQWNWCAWCGGAKNWDDATPQPALSATNKNDIVGQLVYAAETGHDSTGYLMEKAAAEITRLRSVPPVTEDMVERVARAMLLVSFGFDPKREPLDIELRMARAVLTAARDDG